MGLRPQRRPSVKKGEGDSISSVAQTTSASSQGQNNGGNQNNDSGSSPPPTREAWTARGQLLLNFHNAISRSINSPEMIGKCNQIAEDMSRSNNDEERKDAQLSHPTVAEEYSAEAALIVENKSKRDADVRNKSLAVGIFSFVALRSGRGLSSWVRKSIANRRYQFDKVPATGSANHLMQKKAESASALKQPSKLRRFLRLSIDATISTSITLLSGAYIFMPQPTAYIEDMSKLPLVEGKSAYAEIVCPPLLQEYRRTLLQYGSWPISTGTSDSDNEEQGGDTQEDVSLNIIRKFVENCTKRSKYEAALLEERNALNFDNTSTVSRLMKRITNTDKKSETKEDSSIEEAVDNAKKLGTVSIPSPGVPENVAVDLDLDVFLLADDNDEEEENGQDGDDSNI